MAIKFLKYLDALTPVQALWLGVAGLALSAVIAVVLLVREALFHRRLGKMGHADEEIY